MIIQMVSVYTLVLIHFFYFIIKKANPIVCKILTQKKEKVVIYYTYTGLY